MQVKLERREQRIPIDNHFDVVWTLTVDDVVIQTACKRFRWKEYKTEREQCFSRSPDDMQKAYTVLVHGICEFMERETKIINAASALTGALADHPPAADKTALDWWLHRVHPAMRGLQEALDL